MNKVEKRFWDKVDKTDDCWNWTGSVDKDGYGLTRLNGKLIKAHRLSYSFLNGIIPEGMCICHHCDNPGCVKPSHLFMGTDADNVHDAISKGRLPAHGEKHGNSKLTEDDVHEIRRLYSLGNITQESLGKMWRIGQCQIGCIVNRKSWKHI